jgi:hypothetical protein
MLLGELTDLHQRGLNLEDMHFISVMLDPRMCARGLARTDMNDVRVHFGSEADESPDWWLIYAAAAAHLLVGKCRVCNNHRYCSGCGDGLDVHPVLGVRMCALPSCQGQYPMMLRSAACEELAAALHISMTEARRMLDAVACSEAGRTYRTRRRLRRPKVLRSSLDALIWASLPSNGGV